MKWWDCYENKLMDLLFHMTQLINRKNAKSHHPKKWPIVSEN